MVLQDTVDCSDQEVPATDGTQERGSFPLPLPGTSPTRSVVTLERRVLTPMISTLGYRVQAQCDSVDRESAITSGRRCPDPDTGEDSSGPARRGSYGSTARTTL
ncbi:hypothetical protein GCM10010430_39950 [Kitasatospora cystarginea]|uniref:Uncharacterized protein n=1 Tax=Kitasatospora cystarginea TaxID=58350 RepID=A0ABN3EAG8_9ACTN